MSTMTGPRWCARLLSIAYYFLIVPFLYDLFMNGARWRSAYLFPFILFAVAGIQIGYKENDGWVRVWFWMNLAYTAALTCLAFFYPPFTDLVALYPWEKWVHLGLLVLALLFFPLHFILPRTPMKPLDVEEDIEKGLPPAGPNAPNQNPAN